MNKTERIALLKKKYATVTEATPLQYDVCPTRIPELNHMLPGGFPKGKVCLLFGSPGSGKSTTAVETIADEQKKDPNHVTLLIPSERGEDLTYYQNLGLSMNDGRTLIMRKKHYILEEVMEEIQNILDDKDAGGSLVDSILIDSWDGLVGYKEMFTPDGKEKEATKDSVAAKAAGASKMWKRIKGLISDQNTLFLIVAQVRTKGLGGYIVTEGYSGGFALEHNLDLAIQQSLRGLVREKIDGRDVIIGQKVCIKIDKTKVNANAHQSAEVIYKYGKSWDQVEGIWNIASALNIITRNGAWYSYIGFPDNGKGDHKIQGEANAKAFFEESPEQLKLLNKLVNFVDENSNINEEDLIRVFNAHKPKTEEVEDVEAPLDLSTYEEEQEQNELKEERTEENSGKRRGRPSKKA